MPMKTESPPKVAFDKGELREKLDPIAYRVTQENATERPYTNKYYKHYDAGHYSCVVCDELLFLSETKYESGSGWPAFYDIVDKDKVRFRTDASGIGGNLLRIVANPNLIRTEVSCSNCGSHLGHVFDDGPKPTGKRYCVNSSSLNFHASSESDSPDSSSTKPEILTHLATVDGCGKDGFCNIKSRSKKVVEEEKKVQKRVEEAKQEVKNEEKKE